MTKADDVIDVIVIGAGPAGALVAGILAGHGWSVLVAEKHPFPRFRIGESLLPQSLDVLDRAGLLDRVRDIGYPGKYGAVFVSHDASRVARFAFSDAEPAPCFDHAFQVDRASFDLTLAEWARECGANVMHGVAARCVTGRAGTGRASGSIGDRTLHARFVVDAGGLEPNMDADRSWSVAPNSASRVAMFAHVKLDEEPGETLADVVAGDIVIVEHADVWAWLIPLREQCCSVGVVADERVLHALPKGDVEARFGALIDLLPVVKAALVGAQTVMPVQGCRVPTSRAGSLHSDGVVRVGDAVGFIDPVFSSGVCVALAGAERLATAIDRSLSDPSIEAIELQRYEEFLLAAFDAVEPFVTTWYDGTLKRLIFHDHPQPRVRSNIASVLAGEFWREDNPAVRGGEAWLRSIDRLSRSEDD